jgi:hypothetical protein
MSRRSHRHGDRGHGRPHRLEPAHPSQPSPQPGPADTLAAPERPASIVVAQAALPAAEVTADPPPAAPAPVSPASPATPAAPTAATFADARVADQAALGGSSAPAAPLPVAAEQGEPSDGPPMGEGPMAFDAPRPAGCTSPQLRRFIKSRAYIPMHELRRRFAINGPEDDVAAIDLDGTRLYVGLPEREGRLLGELLRGGDVGAELSHDPVTPIIVGVYPMRPVPRN